MSPSGAARVPGPRPPGAAAPLLRFRFPLLFLLLLPGAAWLSTPGLASAQEAPGLDRIRAAADSGLADSARAMLERWRAERSSEAGPEEQASARFLRARLTRDADSAASRYLRVAMEGVPGYGDRAWLRLAQLRLAAGEPARAAEVLERLRSDYPATELAARSWLWTGHARRASGQAPEACAAWRRAVDAAPGAPDDEPVRRRARAALEGCGSEAAEGPEAGAATEGDPAAPAAGDTAAAASGWVVQLGAFRDRAAAEKLRSAAGERAPDVELVIVPPGPDGELYRVQTRPPGDRASARSLHDEFESRQLAAIVVRTDP